MIRKMRDEDSDAVLAIYAQGIETRNATFETELPVWRDWIGKKLPHSRFVYVEGGKVVGWAFLAPVSSRKCYEGVAELSVYVGAEYRGKGIGDRLLRALVESSEEHGIWTLVAVVFPENAASLRLHIKNGFRVVGRQERIAKLDGTWRDTITLERRSEVLT
jgi:L-amino acid N-acyltransferase YncA